MSMRSADLPVLVAGAGPVGLTAALALRAHGLPVTVLEAEPEGRMRPGSRAIFYHRQTLEQWETMKPGLGWQIARQGLVCSTKRTFWREQQVYERSYRPPAPAQLPHSVNLAQADAERLLLNACADADVTFAWAAGVTEVDSTPQGVTVRTVDGGSWRTQFLIAADGARSGVRQAMGIELKGSRSANSFVVVDVTEEAERPHHPERLYYYHHPAVGARNVLLMPFAGGWRADLQLHPDDDPADFNQPEGVARWVARLLPEQYGERISWISTYRFLQVIASTFTDTHHRVLLVGEAAHLFAPFGARGLNSGVPDATAAAAAVAAAAPAPGSSQAAAGVREFAVKRRSAALCNRDAAGAALSHMRAYSPLAKAKRRAAAAAAIAGQRAGQWLDSAPYGPRAVSRGTEAIY